jgi:hypothetical protein
MEEQKYVKLDNGAYLRVSMDENGNPRGFIDFKTPHAKQYAAYILINKDLNLVVEALSHLRSSDNLQIINQSLSFFSVITYSKCFTENTGRGTSLNSGEVFKGANEELIAEHKRILNLRNDYVAHAGSGFERCAVTGTIFMEIGGINLEGNLSYVTNIEHNLDTFFKLCEYVKIHVEMKISVFQKKLFEYFKSLNFEEIMEQTKFPEISQPYILEKESTKMNSESYIFKPLITI